jgi:glycerol-3-phosphate acyltransferase PlsY
MTIIFFSIIAYLLGTFPSGIICATFFKLGDLRQIGSGNTGATNVLRTGNKFAAFLTLLLDGLKGTLAVLLYHFLDDLTQTHGIIFGAFAFLGHVFPIWNGFKGGKGVATYLGILFGLNSVFGIFACILWLVGAFLSKISSVGALNMAVLMPILLFIGQDNTMIPLIMICLSIILIIKHKANIERIISKTEPKIGQK